MAPPPGEGTLMIGIRWSTADDAEPLAALHREAWRNAYAGIIPGLVLERMLARRGGRWWRRMHRLGTRALVLEFDGRLAGYATLGRSRGQPQTGRGEIYELYLRPECQGVGFGRRLFVAARERLLVAGLRRLTVWALAENAAACRFYRAMGGRETGRAEECIGGVRLEKIGFAWP
jgi:ribosomal protein S18 acetylase RimI-like enzyme